MLRFSRSSSPFSGGLQNSLLLVALLQQVVWQPLELEILLPVSSIDSHLILCCRDRSETGVTAAQSQMVKFVQAAWACTGSNCRQNNASGATLELAEVVVFSKDRQP